MIRDLEHAIVARLADLGPLAVAAFPDSPESYRQLHQVAAVLVAYRGMEADPPERLSRLAQVARVRWDIVVLARNLRRHDGAYHLLDAIRGLLLGWRPGPQAGPLWLVGEQYRSQEDGVWQYVATYTCHVAVGDPELVDHLLDVITGGVNLDRARTALTVDQL